MRGKQAFKNMVANLFLQVIVLLSGLILPRFILEAYGSSVNGMITSVNQFLTCRSRRGDCDGSCALYATCPKSNRGSEFYSFSFKKIL